MTFFSNDTVVFDLFVFFKESFVIQEGEMFASNCYYSHFVGYFDVYLRSCSLIGLLAVKYSVPKK